VTIRGDLPPKLRAVLNGDLRCSACRQRPPATGDHRRCWQCSRTGDGTAPPCKGCGGPQWFSGWCMDCHPRMRPPLTAAAGTADRKMPYDLNTSQYSSS
jgi:hypothetical protein